MNKPVDKTQLGYLGTDFQYKLAKCFVEEPGYFQSIYSVVEPNAFTESSLRQFVGTLKDYYTSNGIVPSYETLLMILKSKVKLTTEIDEWDEFVKNLKGLSTEGVLVVEELATKFFKQQNMVKVANEILKRTQDGDTDSYEECIKMMEDALNVGNEDDMGFNPYDIVDEVMRVDSETPIATGIDGLDEALNGGLYKGHLAMIIGPSGFGKTTFSTAAASYASTDRNLLNDYKGWKVLQFCFEDDVKAISKKHFSRITQIEAKDITKSDNIDQARQIIDDFDGKEAFKENLLIKKNKSGTKTVEDLKIYIKGLINGGFRPDLIILDYFECLKLVRRDKNETKWDLQERAMRELEVLAEEFNVALWVMTQGSRDSFGSEVVNMDQAGGSVTKVQIGHVIVSIARSMDDIDNNKALIAILKNRQGASGKKLRVQFNNGTSTISCELIDSYDTELEYRMDVSQRQVDSRTQQMNDILAGERRKYEQEKANAEALNSTLKNEPQTPEPEQVKPTENVVEKVEQEEPKLIRKEVVDTGEFKLHVDEPEPVQEPKNEPVKQEMADLYYDLDDELAIHFDEVESSYDDE